MNKTPVIKRNAFPPKHYENPTIEEYINNSKCIGTVSAGWTLYKFQSISPYQTSEIYYILFTESERFLTQSDFEEFTLKLLSNAFPDKHNKKVSVYLIKNQMIRLVFQDKP